MKDLVDYFDDLPNLMSTMNKDQVSRFQVVEPNSSHSVGVILKGDDHIDDDKLSTKRIQRMSEHTLRNIYNLYNPSVPTNLQLKKQNSVQESSTAVIDKFAALQKQGVDIAELYSQYDINRTGKVSYKDFGDTLTNLSTGLDRAETQMLASQLDGRKVGSVNYKNILTSLQEIASSQPPTPTRQSPLPPSFAENKSRSQQHKQSDNQSTPLPPTDMSDFSYQPRYDHDYGSTETKNNIDSSVTYKPYNRHSNPSSQSVVPNTSFEYLDEMSSVRSSHIIPDRREIISVQSLSPDEIHHVYSSTQTNRQTVGPDERELPRVGRRFYHSTFHHMHHEAAPYHLEPTADQKRVLRKRSSSAPSRARVDRARDKNPNANSLHEALEEMAVDGMVHRLPVGEVSSGEVVSKRAQSVLAMVQAHRESTQMVREMNVKANDMAHRTVENSIVDQLGGRLNQLRFALKQQDPSHSGTVNRGEFQKGLLRSGVSMAPQQVSELYSRLATESASSAVMGYSGNRALNIESFVDRMQMRTAAPAFQHVTSSRTNDQDDDCSITSHNTSRSVRGKRSEDTNSIAHKAARAEELRVVKKVLHHTNKASDPHQAFKHIDVNNVGWIAPDQLQDALARLNTNLTDGEYNLLLNKVDKTSDGKIHIAQFEKALHDTVTTHDDESMKRRQDTLRESRRYNQTFQASDALCAYEVPEYTRLADSASFKKESMRWNKLQAAFQTNQRQVLAAFVPADKETTRQCLITDHLRSNATTKHWKATAVNVDVSSLQELSVSELQRNLQKVGLPLGGDDLNRLQQHLFHRSREVERTQKGGPSGGTQQSGKGGPKVTLEDFCDLVGIQYSVLDKAVIELHNPREVQVDGGTFSSSLKSQTAQPTLSTSMFIGDDQDLSRIETGDRRRKVPQPRHAHTEEPSRFWELTQSSEVAVLYPSPVHSLREPWPNPQNPSLDKVSATRGMVRLDLHASDKVRSAMQGQGSDNGGERRAKKRSASAPPRSVGRQMTTDPILQLNVDIPDNSSSSRGRRSGNNVAQVTTADQIAKWASSSLADYFTSSRGATAASPTHVASLVSPALAVSTSDRLNLSMRPIASPKAQKDGSLTLRRQYTPQHTSHRAPYALDM